MELALDEAVVDEAIEHLGHIDKLLERGYEIGPFFSPVNPGFLYSERGVQSEESILENAMNSGRYADAVFERAYGNTALLVKRKTNLLYFPGVSPDSYASGYQ